ncbi:MAG: cytochrome bc complex cytochrome b subunit [Candidatus Thermoplasmatota archaeon]|nr:cytochrome bc complex cytochrome b subunit [Candidatus Thermoplasmatota archaeon]MCL5791208.1 cytochrome bc complex cytochrome b subunit [Candidatus Thermoplasmatota archaeon]
MEIKTNMIEKIMNEPQPIPRKVPDYMRKAGGFMFWTGAMVSAVFLYEVVTGLILLFYYEPSNAYNSTEAFLNTVPYGSIILTTHLYGAYAMIVLVYIHLLRNLFVGAYKKPREMQWLSGILLLLLTIGVGFFGYSMSGDVLSSDATDVGRGIAGATPVIGQYLTALFFGSGTQLSLFHRLLAWHVVLAALIGIVFLAHFFLAEYNTIMPSGKDSGERAPAIDHDDGTYKQWYPYNLMYMLQIVLYTLGIIVVVPSILAVVPNVPALFSPFPQVSATSPLAMSVPAYPPWFLLFIYKELDFQFAQGLGPFYATVFFAGLPLAYLVLLPYIDTKASLKLVDRPITVSFAVIGVIYLAILSAWGALEPGIAIANTVVVLFYLVPLFVVPAIVITLSNAIKTGRLKNPYAGGIVLSAAFSGVTAFGLGMIVVSAKGNYTPGVIAGLSIVGLLFAISLLFAVGLFTGMYPPSVRKEPVPVSKNTYVAYSSVLGIVSIVILFEMLSMPFGNVYDQSLYGIGLGFLFIIGGVMIRLYRGQFYNE